MNEHAPLDLVRTIHKSANPNAVAIGVALIASIGAMLLVLQWYGDETKAYQQAVNATVQATVGACGMGSIEFHMPAETQAQIRSGCIKTHMTFDTDMP